MNKNEQKTGACYVLIILHIFLGIGALFGGISLVISPSGKLLHMPLSILEHSPFSSYFIPGIILTLFLGVVPIFTAYFLLKNKQIPFHNKLLLFSQQSSTWNLSLYIGTILMAWITIQVYMIKGIHFIHLFYYFLGLLIQFITLLPTVRAFYKKKE